MAFLIETLDSLMISEPQIQISEDEIILHFWETPKRDSELSASFFTMFKEEEIYDNDRSLYNFPGNSLLQDTA